MLTLPSGVTVMNYNEGFNSKMTDREIADLAQRFRVDVLLGGMQLDFVADVQRGVAALKPKLVLLYPPHEMFHAMMGATSRPWSEFTAAAQRAAPDAKVVALAPGTQVSVDDGTVTEFGRHTAPSTRVLPESRFASASGLREPSGLNPARADRAGSRQSPG